MDLLQEGDLLLQCLDASLQVQASQSGSIHILQQFGGSDLKVGKTKAEGVFYSFLNLFTICEDVKYCVSKDREHSTFYCLRTL